MTKRKMKTLIFNARKETRYARCGQGVDLLRLAQYKYNKNKRIRGFGRMPVPPFPPRTPPLYLFTDRSILFLRGVTAPIPVSHRARRTRALCELIKNTQTDRDRGVVWPGRRPPASSGCIPYIGYNNINSLKEPLLFEMC